ncbi:MAG: LolA family protein [Candidatus Goldiibacteriota bacterium]
MKKCLLLFILFKVFVFQAYADNVILDFYQELYDGRKTETSNGRVYIKNFSEEDRRVVYFNVTRPVNQVFKYLPNGLDIYYPEEKKLFELRRKKTGQADLDPVSSAFIKLDFKKLGFEIKKKKVAGNIIEETWVPRNRTAVLSELIIKRKKNDTFLKMESRDKEGKVTMRIVYDMHVLIGGHEMPMYLEVYTVSDGIVHREKLKFSSHKQVEKLPAKFETFTVPEDVRVYRSDY